MRHNGVLLALVAAVLLLGCTSAYSSWIASQNHRSFCSAQNRFATTLHDVVAIAYTPPSGEKLTPTDVQSIAAAQARIFARIDQSRC